MLAAAIIMSIMTKDDGMIGMIVAVALLYAIYLITFFRKEKEQAGKKEEKKESPLLRR